MSCPDEFKMVGAGSHQGQAFLPCCFSPDFIVVSLRTDPGTKGLHMTDQEPATPMVAHGIHAALVTGLEAYLWADFFFAYHFSPNAKSEHDSSMVILVPYK
jgi:hypothetical protein